MVRMARIMRLQKLTKLVRVFKLFKNSNKAMTKVTEEYKMGVGLQRLFFFAIVFSFTIHILSCLWLITATMYDHKYVGTWLEKYTGDIKDFNDLTTAQQSHFYVLAVYWTVTTITTVGYGDISGNNDAERLFCSFAMIAGVISFSFATGSLSSIIASLDNSNSESSLKLEYLKSIRRDLKLPLDLYLKIKNAVSQETQEEFQELHHFLQELPHKLRTQVALYVYDRRYKHIKFFQARSQSFVLWIIPRLKPHTFMEKEYIYMENDKIEEIYFLVRGRVAFVLPRFKAAKYLTIERGNNFGFMDIVGYCDSMLLNVTQWYHQKHSLKRQFCVQSTTDCETLTLNIEDFSHLQNEFPQIFVEIIEKNKVHLRNCLIAKLNAIEYCTQIEKEYHERVQNAEQNIKTDDSQYSFKYSESPSACSSNEGKEHHHALKFEIEACCDVEKLRFSDKEI